jgi:hypothetical protein
MTRQGSPVLGEEGNPDISRTDPQPDQGLSFVGSLAAGWPAAGARWSSLARKQSTFFGQWERRGRTGVKARQFHAVPGSVRIAMYQGEFGMFLIARILRVLGPM